MRLPPSLTLVLDNFQQFFAFASHLSLSFCLSIKITLISCTEFARLDQKSVLFGPQISCPWWWQVRTVFFIEACKNSTLGQWQSWRKAFQSPFHSKCHHQRSLSRLLSMGLLSSFILLKLSSPRSHSVHLLNIENLAIPWFSSYSPGYFSNFIDMASFLLLLLFLWLSGTNWIIHYKN